MDQNPDLSTLVCKFRVLDFIVLVCVTDGSDRFVLYSQEGERKRKDGVREKGLILPKPLHQLPLLPLHLPPLPLYLLLVLMEISIQPVTLLTLA